MDALESIKMRKPSSIKAPCEVCGSAGVVEFVFLGSDWRASCGCVKVSDPSHRILRCNYFQSREMLVEMNCALKEMPWLKPDNFVRCVERFLTALYIGTKPTEKQESLNLIDKTHSAVDNL